MFPDTLAAGGQRVWITVPFISCSTSFAKKDIKLIGLLNLPRKVWPIYFTYSLGEKFPHPWMTDPFVSPKKRTP